MTVHPGRLARGSACLLTALLVLGLLPRSGRAESDAGPAACKSQWWRLDGAAAKPGPEAAFNPSWQPTLKEVVACLRARPTTCLRVQGHFDATQFGRGIEAAFGDGLAVQLSRARGRAEHFISRLHDKGIDGRRLILDPPSMKPTWRGVALRLIDSCGIAAPAPEAPEAPETPPEILPSGRAEAAAPVVIMPETPSTLTLGVTGGSETLWVPQSVEWGARTRVVLDWMPGAGLYTYAGLGVMVNTAESRTVGGDVILGVGARSLPWLSTGVYGSASQGAATFADPWMQRVWVVGLELQTCFEVGEGRRLCAIPRFAPYGQRTRRYVFDGGDLFRVPQITDRVMSAELALGFTQQL